MLDLFQEQRGLGDIYNDVSDLMIGDWPSGLGNGGLSSSWNRSEERQEAAHGLDLCWDHSGSHEPLGLTDMTEEELEVGIVRHNPLVLTLAAFRIRQLASLGP